MMSIFRRRRRDERGQGSLETVGIVTIAAVLVAASTGVVLQMSPDIRAEVGYRICQILQVAGGGDCAEPGAPRTAEDRVPTEPCMANSQNLSVEATASVVVTVKKGYSFLIEEMSDGTFKITRIDTTGIGTGVGPGIDVSLTLDGKKYGVTAIASADVMLAGNLGETWYADDSDGADDVMQSIIANDIVDEVAPEPGVGPIHLPNPVNWAIKQIIGTPGDSDEQFIEGGIEGSGQASVSELVVGAGASIQGELYLGAKQTPDGYVAYFRTSVSAEGYGAVMGQDATAGIGGELLSEILIDSDGTPKSIKMTAGVTLDAETSDGLEDDQKYTEYSYEVPLTGDPLHDAPLYAATGGNPIAMINFIDEAKDTGYVTQNVYSQDPNTYGLTVGGELLGKYGGSISGDATTRALKDAFYWDGNGMVKRPDC